MDSSSAAMPIVEGPGSVSAAPALPEGFAETFASRLVDIGDLRLHAVIGGEGPPLLLVHGWPQTWYAWRLVLPALASNFEVIAVDQRGTGLSDKPADGYDTGTLANDLVALMAALGHDRFALYGTDTGNANRLRPGRRPSRAGRTARRLRGATSGRDPFAAAALAAQLNARLWHLAFNQLPAELNEALVRGREEIFFGAEFDASAGTNKLAPDTVEYYIGTLASDPDALRGSFEFYRALGTTSAQNAERQATRLNMPVLAIGGAESVADGAATTMRLVADDVRGVVLPGSAHWVAEQAPEELLVVLTEFLAPDREAVALARVGAPV